MTALILRLVIIAVIGFAIFWGVRKIWRDWSGTIKAEDRAKLDRDRLDRSRGGMINLKRDKDGKFRPDE